MKKLYYFSFLTLLFAGCGGDTAIDALSSSLENNSERSQYGSKENNTYIPKSGIYNESDSQEIKFLKVINYARSQARECKNNDGTIHESSRGYFKAAPPLTINQELYSAALEHSIDMAKSNTFSHYGSETKWDTTGSNLGHPSSFRERIEANGYSNYTMIGENIAAGQKSIEEVVHSWLESPGHCANIMNPNYKEMGLARYEEPNSFYKVYWTNDFGSR